jgi:predicted ATPase
MNDDKINQYIRYITLDREKIINPKQYPFDLPVMKGLDKLYFHKDVTFIVGENGTGKSTLLEAIAVAYRFNPEGRTKNFNFSTKDSHSNLHEYINLVKEVFIF